MEIIQAMMYHGFQRSEGLLSVHSVICCLSVASSHGTFIHFCHQCFFIDSRYGQGGFIPGWYGTLCNIVVVLQF